MGGGAWPFLVGGAICLVNSVNERDLNLLNSRAYLCGGFTALTWAINPCQLSRAKPGAGGRGPLRSMPRVWIAGWAHACVGWPRVGRLALLRGTVGRIANGSLRQ